MKIECDENTAETIRFCSMWAFPSLVVMAIIVAIWHYHLVTFKTAVEAGYVEGTVQGSMSVVWVKK